MEKTFIGGARLKGKAGVPEDKSISHRAAIVSAIANGVSRISGFSSSADCARTLDCLSMLGVEIRKSGNEILIEGRGNSGLKMSVSALDAGNSATTMRLLSGVLACEPFTSVITGDESLRRRPMKRIIKPLELMGARVKASDDFGHPPLEITGGSLEGIEYTPEVPSAQVKSCILLAGLRARGKTIVHEKQKTRDHTERILSRMGIKIETDGEIITLEPGIPDASNLEIPGDFSSAAFLITAAILCPGSSLEISGVGLNPTRCGFLEILDRMGADIEVKLEGGKDWEPYGSIRVKSCELEAVEIGREEVARAIDEIPLVALLATCARGKTLIRGAEELRVKESDRISGTVKGLSALGAKIKELEDGMEIEGPTTLSGTRIDSMGDHRLAMLFAVAGISAKGKTIIEGWEWTEVSYPDFEKTIVELGGEVVE